jgi:lambda family phage tail tape measure protein
MANNRAQILISAVDQTKAAFDSIKRGLSGLTDTAKSVNGVLANLGVAVSVAGLTAMVKSAIDTGDALDEMSQRVGVSVETLSVWKPVAAQAGVSGESFEKGLRKLSTSMLEAATGSEDAARGFSAVGIEFKNQDGTLRATDQVLLDLADRFKAMPDSAEKTALAVQLFGKSGAELIPFLNQGRDGISALSAEMQALGVQMSGETAAQAGNFNDALDKLQLATRSIGNQIIAALLPALNDMAGGMVESAKQGGTLRAILDGVVLVLKTLALGAATVGKAFVALGEAIGAGVAAAIEALKGNTDGAKAIIADLKGNLVQRLDELASFRDSLFDPKPIEVKAPKIQADPELLQRLTKPKTAKAEQDTTAAQTTLIKAQLDAEFTLLKDGLTRQQTALEAALEDRLVSVRGYYTQKTAIEQREIDAEIARKQSELTRSQQIAATGKTENDRLRAKAEVAKAEAELITLNNRRADVEQANARKAALAERELTDALTQAREELAQITGSATDTERKGAIERSYRDLKAKLLAENDTQGASLVDRLIDVKAAQANLSALEAQWRQVTERMRNAQEAIQTQQQAGLLTESQARQQVVTLQQQSTVEMERLLPSMQQAAQAIGPDAVSRVQAWGNELARTRLIVDEVAVAINGNIENAFARMFESIATGASSAREAFAQFGQSVLQMIAKIAAQKLAQQIFAAFGGGAGGGIGGAIAGLFSGGSGFATGGYVSGPGTSTSDSIPARLSAGEYVVRAAAVRRVGVAFLDVLNGVALGPRLRGGELAFAAGGLVPEVRVPPAQPQVNQSVRIVNAIDPGVTHDHLQSPAGEKVIVNIIGRNARAIRAALQG